MIPISSGARVWLVARGLWVGCGWIGSHFGAGFGCEAQSMRADGLRCFSSGDFGGEARIAFDATVQALAGEDADLDLDMLSQLACLGT